MLDRIAIRPFALDDLAAVRRSFDAAFADAFARPSLRGLDGRHGLAEAGAGLFPRVEVRGDDGGWTLSADLPGWRTDDVKLTFEDGVLTLTGERAQAPEGWQIVRRERALHRFSRALRFADPVDDANIEATLRDGVLTVRVPRVARPAPRTIEVKA